MVNKSSRNEESSMNYSHERLELLRDNKIPRILHKFLVYSTTDTKNDDNTKPLNGSIFGLTCRMVVERLFKVCYREVEQGWASEGAVR